MAKPGGFASSSELDTLIHVVTDWREKRGDACFRGIGGATSQFIWTGMSALPLGTYS